MKKNLFLFLLPAPAIVALFSFIDSTPQGEYQPVFMSRDDLNRSVFYVAESRPLKNPGKIYSLPPCIYVNELYKGVHIIDNSNPQQPRNEAFIVAPGCVDMAIKGGILYLDNAVDLVAFDLTAKTAVKRIENIFPEALPPAGSYVGNRRPEGMILVEWKKRTN